MNSVFGWASDLSVSVPQSLIDLPSRKISFWDVRDNKDDDSDDVDSALDKPREPAEIKPVPAKGSNSDGVAASWQNAEIAKKRLVRHSVCVEGHGEFKSTNEAFISLGLPTAKCIRFRISLKDAGELTYEHAGISYRFRIIEWLGK